MGGGEIDFNIHENKNNSDGRQRENLWPVLFFSLNVGGIHFCTRLNLSFHKKKSDISEETFNVFFFLFLGWGGAGVFCFHLP
jgi:hypothetical protein